jgi:hypothetical protein
MDSVVQATEPKISFEFNCRKYKQKALIEVLLNHSQLDITKLASWLEVPLETLRDVKNGFAYLHDEPAQNLAHLFLILFGE